MLKSAHETNNASVNLHTHPGLIHSHVRQHRQGRRAQASENTPLVKMADLLIFCSCTQQRKSTVQKVSISYQCSRVLDTGLQEASALPEPRPSSLNPEQPC